MNKSYLCWVKQLLKGKMETIQIEIRNKNVLSILKGLEKANLIRLIVKDKKESLKQFKGTISDARAAELADEIDKSRAEWNKRII